MANSPVAASVDKAFLDGFALAARRLARLKRGRSPLQTYPGRSLREFTRESFLRGLASGMLVAVGEL